MRYERVQKILEEEPALRGRLSPRTVPIETRFNENILFSQETITITEAIHAEGKDAHKVPKHEILLMAAKQMRLMPGNGTSKAQSSPPKPSPPVKATPAPQPKSKAAKKPQQQAKAAPRPAAKSTPAKEEPKAAKRPEPRPVETRKTRSPEPAEQNLPQSELPPEKQPLKLPANFDPRKHPHYSVQSSIYSLLLSALAMSESFEKFPGMEERQKELCILVKKYQDTCDPLKQTELAES